MLSNWVSALSLNLGEEKRTLAKHILSYQDELPLYPGDVVLVGSDVLYHQVLEHLAGFAWTFEAQRIIALGIVRRTEPTFLMPLFEELKSAQVTTIFIGANPQLKMWFDLYERQDAFFSPAIVDEKLSNDPEGPLAFLHQHLYKCFHINFLATQMHLNLPTVPEDSPYLIENLRLGKLRSNKELVEPALRDSNFMVFNLNAVKKSDAQAKSGVNPSGLNAEEADQICRYAGLSESLTLLNISGYEPSHADTVPTVELMAQMIWYFLDGYVQRKQDYPLTENELTQYVVDLTEPNTSLFFLKSKKSGRWWLKIPVEVNQISVDRLLPCTYHDYQLACEHELSERILQALERYV